MHRPSPNNEISAQALSNALIDEAYLRPEPVLDGLAIDSAHTRIFAKVACDARLKDTWPLIEPLQKESPETLALVLRMAGRIRGKDALPLLLQSLDHDEANVREEAAGALLRLGMLGEVVDRCRSPKGPVTALGLGGGKSEVPFLIQLAENGPSPGILLALGLLGDIAAFPVLLDALDRDGLSEPAAQALELITGAGIQDKIFTPEEIDKKELFPNELEKLERDGCLYPPGEEPGTVAAEISQNSDAWRGWMDQNTRQFKPETRYRNGRPCSPESLIENMKSETLPRFLRQLAHEEMVIRYKVDFPFETDRPASFQKQALGEYEIWANSAENSFEKGQWYFAGLLTT